LAYLGQAIFDRKERKGQAFVRAFCMLLANFCQASSGPAASSCPAIPEHLAHAVGAFAQPCAGTGQAFAQQVKGVLQARGMQYLRILRAFGRLGQASCGRAACIGQFFFCVLLKCLRQTLRTP